MIHTRRPDGALVLQPVRTASTTSGKWYRRAAVLVLALVAVVGAVLSWGSLYAAASVSLGAASPRFRGINLVGAAFPLLLDALILGASLRYVGGVKAQRPVAGWRVAAHAGIAGTVALNAAAAESLANVPWHIVAPLVWSLIVELYARDVLGELREVRRLDTDRIPLRLWLSAPGESLRTSWRMARTGERSAEQARVSADRCAAARDALQRALPGRRHRRSRRQITRRLWAGSIDAADVFAAIGWTDQPGATQVPPPEQIIRTALRSVLRPVGSDVFPSPADSPAEPPAPIHDLELVPPSLLDDLDDPSDDLIEDASDLPAPRPAVAPLHDSKSQSVSASVQARPQDVARLEAAIAAGELASRPSIDAVRRHLPHQPQLCPSCSPSRP